MARTSKKMGVMRVVDENQFGYRFLDASEFDAKVHEEYKGEPHPDLERTMLVADGEGEASESEG